MTQFLLGNNNSQFLNLRIWPKFKQELCDVDLRVRHLEDALRWRITILSEPTRKPKVRNVSKHRPYRLQLQCWEFKKISLLAVVFDDFQNKKILLGTTHCSRIVPLTSVTVNGRAWINKYNMAKVLPLLTWEGKNVRVKLLGVTALLSLLTGMQRERSDLEITSALEGH